MNRRAKPRVSYRVIVDPVGATTTKTGSTVCIRLSCSHAARSVVPDLTELDNPRAT